MPTPLDDQIANLSQRIASAQQAYARAEAHLRVAQDAAVAKYGTSNIDELTKLLEQTRNEYNTLQQSIQTLIAEAEQHLTAIEALLPKNP